jgi:DNA repair protein SbcC/Rad50
MRIHHLSVTAFGPFPSTENIDFAELNAAGLFLLTGPTGAGKSCLLDAICFALYGQVPGVRGVKALKSQHAADGARPEVMLDFSIGSRRFVVRRTPEWERPKRRGEGTLSEKASASLVETTSGSDHFLSSRAQEVGHLISELIGMHAAQFEQVAMLPQGEFQKFLQATSQERHDVLQRLFKTDRFSRIEDWVQDHSRTLRDRSDKGEIQVQRILDSLADRAGIDLPAELSDLDPASSPSCGQPLPWAETLLDDAEGDLTVLRTTHQTTVTRLAAARADHVRATQLALAIARRDEAVRALDALAHAEPSEAEAVSSIEADTRASRCSAVLDMLDDATTVQIAAASEREVAQDAVGSIAAAGFDVREALTSTSLVELEREVRARIIRIDGLLPRETALRAMSKAVAAGEADLISKRSRLAKGKLRHKRLPDERAALRRRLVDATEVGRRKDALTGELRAAQGRLDAALLVPGKEVELARVREAQRAARDASADAREAMQDVVSKRLAGIAAELAGRLEEGEACQVCGSTDHPRPAAPATDAVTEADQERATRDYDRLLEQHTSATRRTTDAQRALDALLRSAGGLDTAAAAVSVSELSQALTTAEQADATRLSLEKQLTGLELESTKLTERLHDLETEIATLDQALETQRSTIDEVTMQISAAVGDLQSDLPLTSALDSLRAALRTITHVTISFRADELARQHVDELTLRTRATAEALGFASVEDVRAALVPADERARLEQLLAERARTQSRARLVLEDPEVQAVANQSAPDVSASVEELAAAQALENAKTRELVEQEQLVGSLRANLTRLRDAMVIWSPARDDYLRAEAMSRLVRGMGAENHLQMRLSAYVLATRLDQVVAAANERLAHMRDQRYLLERTGKAARKSAQAGLGLQIVDEWTGDVRDPATLSGGETFVVSLSLALGLADVVTQEAGGTEIETLFVDEGFGMLDADTLDDVMDRLDGLRAGGRTVGVVSHVPEIRNRIPTQVHVEKRRTGSTVAVRTMVA